MNIIQKWFLDADAPNKNKTSMFEQNKIKEMLDYDYNIGNIFKSLKETENEVQIFDGIIEIFTISKEFQI